MADRLHLAAGDRVLAVETERGILLTPYDPAVEEGFAIAARARHKWVYEQTTDMAVLGAAYAFGLATGHPYRDGNKRIALLAMVVFLGLNAYDFEAPEAEVVTMMLAAADHRATKAELAMWIRSRMVALPD